MPSKHTKIGAWVNSKMSGKPTVILYNYIDRHAGTPNKTKTNDTISLDYSSLCYIASRIGWVSMKGIYKLVLDDVDVILESCPITIRTRLDLLSIP